MYSYGIPFLLYMKQSHGRYTFNGSWCKLHHIRVNFQLRPTFRNLKYANAIMYSFLLHLVNVFAKIYLYVKGKKMYLNAFISNVLKNANIYFVTFHNVIRLYSAYHVTCIDMGKGVRRDLIKFICHNFYLCGYSISKLFHQ